MSASNEQLSAARTGIQSVTSGTDVNQDAWMTQWCSTNWGDLLQPAPLSIALLGSILLIASSADDFSLDQKAPAGAPPFVWKYARHPDSFKACLQQMVGNGYLAFGTAHKNMDVIKANSGQIPSVIKSAVSHLRTGSSQTVLKDLSQAIDDLRYLSENCRAEAEESTIAFRDLTGLAQEMVLACTYTAGSTEKALAQNKTQLDALKMEKESEETMMKDAKDYLDLMKNSYLKAENEFKQAIDDFPSGWDLMGMAIVEGFTDVLNGIGNVLSSSSTLKSQGSKNGLNAFSSSGENKDVPATPAPTPVAPTTSPNGISSQPNSDALSDPATTLVPIILVQVTGIKLLLTGGEGGKPDWDKIRSKDGSKSGAAYIQAVLALKKEHLDTSKSFSKKLSAYIDTALSILDVIINTAASTASTNDNVFADQLSPMNELLKGLQALSTSANLVLQQPGCASKGLAVPTTPTDSNSGAGPQAAIDNAMMKVDQSRAQLDAARSSYQKAAVRLAEQQQEITKTIVELTQVSLQGATLEDMLPVLKKAVGCFSVLRAQFAQLSQFFTDVSSLMVDIMIPSVTTWTKTLESAEDAIRRGEQENHIAGVTFSTMTREIIYRTVSTPVKVSLLATRISSLYLEISHDFIIPAQENLDNMLKFPASVSAADKATMVESLEKDQDALRISSAQASAEFVFYRCMTSPRIQL
ncbi:hypothetical protein DFH08DRAFT_412450 [Mycena albidolilacea]|uniref:Uncharacterized protein n=1 Tax=Mycena albidolilacea TaxID=1033008 RepID=A0AAD7AIC8_9AGAR|nr:hypothetical protein DFH08DRAFT_412450 [Mycena albidolilacea]